MLGYDNLVNYFRTNFALIQHHGYSLAEIENMVPWERFVYLDLLKQHIKEKEEALREQQNMARVQANIRNKR